jgi:hypothetical protein
MKLSTDQLDEGRDPIKRRDSGGGCQVYGIGFLVGLALAAIISIGQMVAHHLVWR